MSTRSIRLAVIIAAALPGVAAAQGDAQALLSAARGQIEEFAYDSAAKLLARVLNAPGQAPAVVVRANTLFAINELNRVADGKGTARGAFLEALRVDPTLLIDTLTQLHSDAKTVFADAVALMPPAAKAARTAASAATSPQVVAAKRVPARRTPGALPSQLTPRVVKVDDRDKMGVLDLGYEEKGVNVLDPTCLVYSSVFWDIMGYELDTPRLCLMSTLLFIEARKEKPAQTLINYTSVVRRKDGAVELDTRPAPVAEWLNETTGKRIQFNVLGDNRILITDMTPTAPMSVMPQRRADTVVAVTLKQGEKGTYYNTRFESQGAPLAIATDALPMELTVVHVHRGSTCEGTLSFDGDLFRYSSPESGGHTFRFTVDDIISGAFTPVGGTLRARVGGEQQFAIKMTDWRDLYAGLANTRRR